MKEIRKIVEKRIGKIVPAEAYAFWAVSRSMRAQGSLEYIMMIAAASVVIVIALAMVLKLKGSVGSNVVINGNSMSVSQAITSQLSNLSANLIKN